MKWVSNIMVTKETMTSQQRLIKTLNHEIPDRVPIDFGGFQSGIHKKAYARLLEYLGINDEVKILDPVQQLARPCEELLERFHVDIRYVCAHGPDSFKGGIEQNMRKGQLWHDLKDEFGVVWSMPDKQKLYMDMSHHPLANATIADIENYPFPDGGDPTRFTGVREEALQIRNHTPYAISTGIGGVVYEQCWYMRGLEKWFMDTIENPAFCEALLDKMLEFWIDYYNGFMSEIGDIIDVVMIGDDLAGQGGPLFSTDFYSKVVKPRQKTLVQHIKSLLSRAGSRQTDAKICYHTCGSCFEYIPELIDNGIDILNPVQVGLVNMEPEKIKEKFGSQLTFWGGGIDAQRILPFAEPGQIRDQVRKNLEIFKPGGGYVFSNDHNIQLGVPPENIVAMFDAAYEFAFYD